MNKGQIIKKTATYIKNLLGKEATGHDWFHIERVVKNAKIIAKNEGGDIFIIELAALLHDVADWKFYDGDDTVGAKKTKEWLKKLKVNDVIITRVADIVQHISYKGGANKTKIRSLEGKVVQDADRLDALGAIGIGRTFAFGGHSGIVMYDPAIKPKKYKSLNDFKKSIKDGRQSTINHFYEKLLLLKGKMNTKTGKKLALLRHKFLKQFLKQFYKEWNVR